MSRDQWTALLDPKSAIGVAAAITILTAMLSPSCTSNTERETARADEAKQQRLMERLDAHR